MPLRTREPGAKDIGYLKYLARRYNFADGLMFAALRELEIYYLLHTPLDHRFVQEMGFNGRRGQRVLARFDAVAETAVCPYPVSFRDYLELEMVRNTDVYVQLPGLEVPEHTTVFKSDNRRATKRCARDVRLGSDEVYVWVRDLLLHGISPYSLSYALSRAGYKVSKDSGVITRAIHEIHSSLMTPGGKAELQRIMAETPMLGQSARSPLVRPEERIITPPSSLRGIPGETISFTGYDGKHYNYAYKCVTNITEFFNIFEISYFKYLYETYADHGAILDYIALYTPPSRIRRNHPPAQRHPHQHRNVATHHRHQQLPLPHPLRSSLQHQKTSHPHPRKGTKQHNPRHHPGACTCKPPHP